MGQVKKGTRIALTHGSPFADYGKVTKVIERDEQPWRVVTDHGHTFDYDVVRVHRCNFECEH